MENKTQEEASTINVSSLTCIDLANTNLHQSADALKQACLDCGFFYVTNHGISEELKDEAFEQSKKFFALPLDEKMKVLKNEKHQGDYKESFFIGIEGSNDTPFCRANIWPNPDVLPGWQATMEKYHQEALRVCKAIARVLALALDVDGDYFDKPEMLGNPLAFMRLLHYEGMSDPSKGIYGCGPHSDFGMMTLLATDSVMGLQICKDRDVKPRKWEYIPSIKGYNEIILIVGSMLHFKHFTNFQIYHICLSLVEV
ncbi:hypothetical protein ARALYDRAFT_905838 [Arabidopsis lyrata subsp. lyrata]|uniref:Fe2OG dioxygenase domain-containing protein n=1 Tax=Arabidopsis lyrata subsp. lyrata TaxID=81972 RepID=D7LN08_ARALL|nr:hypothetical protein ARALYDRAFT_905838 [Arabidopsis lyrata subsp. lyrata]